MGKNLYIAYLCFASLTSLLSQSNPILHTIYLIGDAGKDTTSGKALLHLKALSEKDKNSSILFLGDNIYDDGFPKNSSSKEFRLAAKKIESQLSILINYEGNAFMVPGNHDWRAGKTSGYKSILAQKEYVENYITLNTKVKNKSEKNFLPSDGLPGPETFEIDNKIRLIFVDLQWWLHPLPFHKVGSLYKLNKKELENKFFFELDSLLKTAKKVGQKVIIAAHHPLITNGRHSKKYQPWRFLINHTPLQVLGLMGGNRFLSQDIFNPRYKRLRKKIITHITTHYPDVIFVAGHDHNLQYLKTDTFHQIISGSGSKISDINSKPPFQVEFMDDSQIGFTRLILYKNGKINIEFWGSESKTILFSDEITK